MKKAAAQNERLTADIQSYVNKNKDLKDKVMRLESALEKVCDAYTECGASYYNKFALKLYFCKIDASHCWSMSMYENDLFWLLLHVNFRRLIV